MRVQPPVADLLLPILVACAAAEAVLWAGGYGPAARVGFVVLAALALAAAIRERPGTAWTVARRPAIIVLLALGALGILSAAWTVGAADRAIRWGLVTCGYAAVAIAAGVLARRAGGAAGLAAGIAVLAFVSGVVGLVGVALGEGPFADRIGGSWRPGGTLEYSAALSLLQVSALPVLLGAIASPSRWARAAGLAGGAVAVAVLWLAASRLELVLAAGVLLAGGMRWAWAHGWRPRTLGLLAGGALVAGVALALMAGAGSGGWHGRPAVWQAALDVAADHPLIGAGADSFLVASLPHVTGDPVTFAHDLPLELAAELGILGLTGALLLYGATARAWWQARSTRAAWLLGPAAGAFLIASLVDWPWHLAGSGAVWAVALGGLLGAAGETAAPQRHTRQHS